MPPVLVLSAMTEGMVWVNESERSKLHLSRKRKDRNKGLSGNEEKASD